MLDNNKSYSNGLLQVEDVLFSKSGLPTDKLHIHCQVHYKTKKTVFSGSTVVPQSSSTTASGNVLFYEPTTFSDLEIHVRGVFFPAHKVLPAASSAFFSVIFQSDVFTEQNTNILKIYDLEPPLVKEVIRFLYTGRVAKMDELVIGLLVAAEKYMIAAKPHSPRQSQSETAASHLASNLKTVASRFVMQHAAEVSITVGWNVLKQTHPHLDPALPTSRGKLSYFRYSVGGYQT